MIDQGPKSPGDYLEIMKRRKWSFLLPLLLVSTTAAVVALALPPVYRSSSTVLIEQQEIPPDFVMSTVTSFAEQRIQMITQRIMSFTRLREIIERFNLYADRKARWTLEEMVERMRDDIKLKTISAEVTDQRTVRGKSATIAFTLSYEGKSPAQVYQVANVLASLYLEENLRFREQQALGASAFLEEEAAGLKEQLSGLGARLADYRQRHMNELPELLEINMQSLERMDRDLERVDNQRQMLRERERYLKSQLAGIPVESIDANRRRLDELRVKLVYLRTRFSEEYPDVIKTRTELDALEGDLKLAKSKEDGVIAAEGSPASTPHSDNPAYQALAQQLADTQVEIGQVERQLRDLQQSRDDYRRRVEATPRLEIAYKEMMIERENTQAKYNDLMRKFMEAKVAHGLERDQKGERFTIIDPAREPEKPIKPNRLAIVLVGLLLGVGAGVATAALRELADHSVRAPDLLERMTAFPVLATVPEIVTAGEVSRRNKRRKMIAAGAVVVFVLGIAGFHFFVMDLDVFWARLARRLG